MCWNPLVSTEMVGQINLELICSSKLVIWLAISTVIGFSTISREMINENEDLRWLFLFRGEKPQSMNCMFMSTLLIPPCHVYLRINTFSNKKHEIPLRGPWVHAFPAHSMLACSLISRIAIRSDSTRFFSNAARAFAFAPALSCCRLHPGRDSGWWGCGEGCRKLDERWQSWSLHRLAPGWDDGMICRNSAWNWWADGSEQLEIHGWFITIPYKSIQSFWKLPF